MHKLDIEVPYFLQNTNEQSDPEEAIIIGKIPSYIHGTILAVAPGKFDLPNGSFNHIMDGLAILQRFEITDKSIKFTKRFVQSEAYKNAIKAGKPSSIEIGTHASQDSKKGLFAKLKPFGPYDLSDNAVGVIWNLSPKSTLIFCDSSYFHKINAHSLTTLERYHTLKTFGLNGLSPIPIKDPITGDLYTMGSSTSGGFLKHQVVRFRAKTQESGDDLEKKFEAICTIPSRWYSVISVTRCFAISENYFIFVEQPVVFNGVKFTATNMKGYRVRDWIDWEPNELNRFYLIEKKTGKLLKNEVYSDVPFHSLTVLNAFEDKNLLMFDCVTSPNLDALDNGFLTTIHQRWSQQEKPEGQLSKITRFILPLDIVTTKNIKTLPENTNLLADSKLRASAIRKGQAIYLTPQNIVDFAKEEEGLGIDFGQINKSYIGKKYTHFFATSGLCSMNSKYFGKLCKVNMDTGDVTTWTPSNEDGQGNVTLPLFIPNEEEGDGDDDGVLIASVAMANKADRNYLVFIDGKSFKEIGRCYFNEKIAIWACPILIN